MSRSHIVQVERLLEPWLGKRARYWCSR